MNCKVEKTKNANEVKLEITIEAEKFENAIKRYISKVQNILTSQDLEKEKHHKI